MGKKSKNYIFLFYPPEMGRDLLLTYMEAERIFATRKNDAGGRDYYVKWRNLQVLSFAWHLITVTPELEILNEGYWAGGCYFEKFFIIIDQ